MSLLTNVLKLWRTGQYLLPADSGFMVKHLFANGEPGFAKLDFSGFAGMYQDRARTIPYTAVEQPLGSFTGLNGVAATAPADVNRGVVSSRVNLLTKTEQFDDAVWVINTASGANCTKTANATVAPNGTLTADLITSTALVNDFIYQSPTLAAGSAVTMSLYVKNNDSATMSLMSRVTVTAMAATINWTGSVLSSITLTTGTSASFVDVGSGWYRVSLSFTTNETDQYVRIFPGPGKSVYVWGASLTLSIDAHLPYQWVNTATDYDTAGFPHYLAFNGTNTTYTTPSIDFTGTDKMTVWAGVSGGVAGTPGVILAHNDFGLSSFQLMNPGFTPGVARMSSAGLSAAFAVNAASPTGGAAVILSGQVDTNSQCVIRQNGIAAVAAGAGGGGYYKNAPLSIGSSASGRYFNDRLYSLIVRGAQTSLSQIEATENLIRKTMRLP